MNTLYISDLDGTLLNAEAAISAFTVQTLQKFLQDGGLFSIATARTLESVNQILAEILPLPVPVILMNGALIYDGRERRFTKKAVIEPKTVRELLACAKAHGQTGILYSHEGDFTRPHYDEHKNEFHRMFHASREKTYGKHLIQTDDLAAHADEEIIYFTMRDTRENLAPLHEALQKLPLHLTFYPENYAPGCWMLECLSPAASKYNALRWLREAYSFDKIIGFGDNLNDIPLFRACDESYAVANAREELKALATGVIGDHNNDGVATFLCQI